jgi:outer membrane protein assembly factor BamB
MTKNEKNIKSAQFLTGVAWVSAIFGFVVCILVIANYFQTNNTDPVNNQVIDALVQRLNENPDDAALRLQIQELDLLARKAFFTNQWQVKTGGYLILVALAIFIISFQIRDANVKQHVLTNPDHPKDILGIQKNARLGISILGSGLVIVALLLTFLTHRNLGEKLAGVSLNYDQNTNTEIAENNAASSLTEQENEPIETDAQDQTELLESQPETSINIEAKTNIETEKGSIESKSESKPAKSGTVSIDELKRNFTSFRGYNGNGIVYQKNVPTQWNGPTGENMLWKTEVPVQGYNSPIIWENRVFLSGATESVREVFCFDRINGKLLWRTKVDGIPGSPAVSPKTTSDTGLAASSMTTDGKRVFAIFGNGDIIALDMDGKKVWAMNLGIPQNHYGHSSSLIMYKDKLIVQYDQKTGSKLMALAASTGATVWSTPRKVKISWASPIIVENSNSHEIILVADPIVASYNPETGAENWQLNCIYGEVGPSAAYTNGIVYALNEYAKLVAISLANPGEVLWEDDEILSDIPSPVAANGLLIVVASYGAVACFDALSGEKYWDHEFDNNTYASPMVVGENVYLMDTKGTMHIFKLAKSFELVAKSPLGENVVTTPAFADGRIYIRSDKNLYCFGK